MLHNVSSGGLKRSSWEKYISAIHALSPDSTIPAHISSEHWKALNAALEANEPPEPKDVA